MKARLLTIIIDFATALSAARFLDGRNIIPIKSPIDGACVPSLFYQNDDGTIIVGKRAERLSYKSPDGLICHPKPRLPLDPHGELFPGGPSAFDCLKATFRHFVDVACASMPEVKQAREDGRLQLAVSRPTKYGLAEDRLYRDAAADLGLTLASLHSESDASAHFVRRDQADRLQEGMLVLVVDIGGGTLDISLLRYTCGRFDEVVGGRGHATLAGDAFTKPVFDLFCDAVGHPEWSLCFPAGGGIDLTQIGDDLWARRTAAKLIELADETKRALSNQSEVEQFIELPDGIVEVTVTQDQFRELNRHNFSEVEACIAHCLDGTEFSRSDVDIVALSGGAAFTLDMHDVVCRATVKSPSNVLMNPDGSFAVVEGTAAQVLYGESETTAKVLAKGALYAVDLRRDDGAFDKVYREILPAGTSIPAKGDSVELKGEILRVSQTGVALFEMEFAEYKDGCGRNGSPYVSPDQVIPLGSTVVRREGLPPGEHFISFELSYSMRHLSWQVGLTSHPEIEAFAGSFLNGNSEEKTPPAPKEIVVLMDQSGSMGGEPLMHARLGAKAFLDIVSSLPCTVGIVSFNSQAQTVCDLTSDLESVKTALDSITAKGGTALDIGLEHIRKLFDDAESTAEKIIVVLTDGRTSCIPAKSSAARLRDSGCTLFTIACGNADRDLLDYHIASSPEFSKSVDQIEQLKSAFESVARLIVLQKEEIEI